LPKSLTHGQLKSAIGNLQSALKTAQAREAEKNNKRRAANIKKLASMMAEMGLSPSDIARATSGKGQKAGPRKAKVGTKTTAKKSKGGTQERHQSSPQV
jgi:DNA-binding protein H-NS